MNLKELGANLGLEEDEYKELIELFIETGTADFQNLQSALAENNAEQVMRSAHTIKGASGNLGLVDVSQTAGIIEDKADKNQLDNLAQAVETLKTQFDAIIAFVRS